MYSPSIKPTLAQAIGPRNGRPDIVIAAVGKPKFIKCTGLKKGSILIDAGYHPIEKCGDVDMNGIEDIVSAYTPVPGGVGPMTINTLIYNTIKSMEKTFNV